MIKTYSADTPSRPYCAIRQTRSRGTSRSAPNQAPVSVILCAGRVELLHLNNLPINVATFTFLQHFLTVSHTAAA